VEWPFGIETDSSGGDQGFVRFLQADQARVLLPVRPAEALPFLYFLACGELWPGRRAPVVAADIALVADLVATPSGRQKPVRVGDAWAVVVPTPMTVLDDSAVGAVTARPTATWSQP
jgi:hypothetical protein